MAFRKLSMDELGRLSTEEMRHAHKSPLVLVLDNVRSALNVGSVFRTADAFRVETLYLCGITACPPNRDIEKTALGATESVTWKQVATTYEAIAELKAAGYCICAVEQAEGSTMLDRFQPNAETKYALVFGHEVFGVDDQVLSQCDVCLEIPQQGSKHSLNVSVTAGILAWHFTNKNKSPNT